MATYLKCFGCIDPPLKSEVMKVAAMEECPEFELTEEQIREFAQRLMV
jgi:hypothetical protein